MFLWFILAVVAIERNNDKLLSAVSAYASSRTCPLINSFAHSGHEHHGLSRPVFLIVARRHYTNSTR